MWPSLFVLVAFRSSTTETCETKHKLSLTLHEFVDWGWRDHGKGPNAWAVVDSESHRKQGQMWRVCRDSSCSFRACHFNFASLDWIVFQDLSRARACNFRSMWYGSLEPWVKPSDGPVQDMHRQRQMAQYGSRFCALTSGSKQRRVTRIVAVRLAVMLKRENKMNLQFLLNNTSRVLFFFGLVWEVKSVYKQTSACDPGARVFLHLSHRRHGRCQSFPKDVTFSAGNREKRRSNCWKSLETLRLKTSGGESVSVPRFPSCWMRRKGLRWYQDNQGLSWFSWLVHGVLTLVAVRRWVAGRSGQVFRLGLCATFWGSIGWGGPRSQFGGWVMASWGL